MTETTIEIVTYKDGEELFFYDIFPEDIDSQTGEILTKIVRESKQADSLSVTLAGEDGPIDIFESQINRETIYMKLLEGLRRMELHEN